VSDRHALRLLPVALAIGLACCGHERVHYAVTAPARDFVAFPAVVTRPMPPVLYALSDVHGGYDRMVTLLETWGLVAKSPASPAALRWTAGNAILVVVGDLVDKGPRSVDVVDALMALQTSATLAGGDVIVLLGNHEAEYFVDPGNDKTTKGDGFASDLDRRGLSPVDVASGQDPRGLFLRQAPLGAKVGSWFFAHAGRTHGRSLEELEGALSAAILRNDHYEDAELTGPDSILEARDWWGDGSVAVAGAKALGVAHIVMGHDPNALGVAGSIQVGAGTALLRIDCGLSPGVDYSDGRLLRVRIDGGHEIAEELRPNGNKSEIFNKSIN